MRAKMKALVDKPKEARRQKFDNESHDDDCGDDIKGLGMSDSLFSFCEGSRSVFGR